MLLLKVDREPGAEEAVNGLACRSIAHIFRIEGGVGFVGLIKSDQKSEKVIF
jgi:hypothetical protein